MTQIHHAVCARTAMAEDCQTKQLNLVITFTDFKNSCDSIRCPALNSILAAFGTKDAVQCGMALYYKSKAVVTTTDGEANPLNYLLGYCKETLWHHTRTGGQLHCEMCHTRQCALPSVHGWVLNHVHLSCACSIRSGHLGWHCLALTQPCRCTSPTHGLPSPIPSFWTS